MPASLPDSLFEGEPIAQDTTGLTGDLHLSRRLRLQAERSEGKRLDIQGLRALAVVLVVLDHVGSWPHGGFIGVDVFFVISGFLITGVLLRSARKGTSARSYFADFYRGRVRRILPAAVTVLVATWVAADLVFRGARVTQTHADIWWASGFSANIHFANIGTDYFQSERPPSLVQHYWSLAVEEQYYVVWPIIVLLILTIVGRKRGGGLTMLLATVALLTVASFVWAIHDTSVAETAAYFSTNARAWELGVGSTLAVALVRFPSLGGIFGRNAGPLALLGVLGIVASAVYVKSDGSFPAPAAAPPVMAAALVILAGTGLPLRQQSWVSVLTNRVSTYLGDISYSLYLWHWPTILVVAALVPPGSIIYYPLIVTATLALSVFGYHLIEEPFRRHRSNSVSLTDRRHVIGRATLAALILIVATLGLYSFKPDPKAPKLVSVPPISSSAPQEAVISKTDRAYEVAIAKSLSSTSWPDLDPSLDDLDKAGAPEWIRDGCLQVDQSNEQHCLYGQGSARKLAVVFGDSFAASLMPGIRNTLEPKGWKIQELTHGECPVADVPTVHEGQPFKSCTDHRSWVIQQIRSLRPDLVILSDSWNDLHLIQAAGGDYASMTAGLEKFLSEISGFSMRTVIVSGPPGGKGLENCDTTVSTPSDCVTGIASPWRLWSDAQAAAAQSQHVQFLNLEPYVCYRGRCPAVIGSTPVYVDGNHLTAKYSARLSPALREHLLVG